MNQGFNLPQFVGKGAKTQITGEQTCESLFPDVPSKHVWKIKESCYVYTTIYIVAAI